jgi:hypothetical protein
MLDRDGTLLAAEPIRGSHSARKGMAQWVLAVAIGILLCTMSSAGGSKPVQYVSYKEYSLYLLDFNVKEYKCLSMLYGKESAWNPKAVNGSHYGIPQGRSTYLATLNGYDQVQWGLDYIGHRYGEPCIAWQHFKDKGWH